MNKTMSAIGGCALGAKKTLFVLFLILAPSLLLADGGLIPPPNYYAWETDQQGVIFYESSTQKETLVLSTTFQGNAKDFAWIIPTPSKPEVVKGSQKLFTALDELTYSSSTPVYDSLGISMESGAAPKESVTIVEKKTVDYYDITVLSSEDSKALVNWLNEHGYQYPEKYAYIFNEYINNGWYFVAARIMPELAADSVVTSELSQGNATPLQLSFTTKNIVYPLKISQIAANDTTVNSSEPLDAGYSEIVMPYSPPSYMTVLLYVITDHKQELAGFTTQYADEVEKKDIESWALNTNGDAWVEPTDDDYYLTKLYKYYAIADMDEDLFPKQAEEDEAVKLGYDLDEEQIMMLVIVSLVFSAIGIIGGIISPFGLIFIIFTIIFFYAKNLKVKITFAIFQILDAIATFLLSLTAGALIYFAFRELYQQLEYSSYADDEIFATCAAIAACFTLLIFTIVKVIILLVEKKKFKKYKIM